MDLGDCADINAARRLIQDDQPRSLHEAFANHDFLLVAPGELDNPCILVGSLDVEAALPLARQGAHLGYADQPAAVTGCCQETTEQVLGDVHGLEEALALAVLR